MRKLLPLAILFSLSSHAGISIFKIDRDGMYRFKSQPFMVWAPKECLLDMAVRDTNWSVDFTTGAGYWMASGQYSVQVFSFDRLSIDDKHSFEQRIKDVAPEYMVHDRSKAFKFVFRDAKPIEIAGHPRTKRPRSRRAGPPSSPLSSCNILTSPSLRWYFPSKTPTANSIALSHKRVTTSLSRR